MEPVNLCPLCGAPAPAPPATTCRYCRYSWAPVVAPAPSAAAPVRPPAPPTPPSTTFAGLSFEETLAAAKRHLEPLDDSGVYLASHIPADKERNARQIYEGQLPQEEPLVVLYDSTVFGSAENGFLLTARRFCWKNAFFNPQALPWRSIQLQSLGTKSSELVIMENEVSCLSEELAGAMLALVREVASEAQRRSPPNFTPSSGSTDGIIDLVRQHLGVDDALYIAPAIPEKKSKNVRSIHKIEAEELILALFDNTVFGSAEESIVFTNKRICWKESFLEPTWLSWHQLAGGRILLKDASEGLLEIHEQPLHIIGGQRERISAGLVSLLKAVVEGNAGYR